MKTLLFLTLFIPAVASSATPENTGLTILTHCGNPIAFFGVLEGRAIFATPDDIQNTPAVEQFFTTLWNVLPLSEGRPMVEELKAENLSGVACPKYL